MSLIDVVIDHSSCSQDIIKLANLIQANINIPTYQLSQEQINWIELILRNSPSSFNEIDSVLETIINSGNVSIQIIPQLIQLFTDVYNNSSTQLNIANSNNIYVFVKFTLDVVLDSNVIVLPNVDSHAIKSMIDISLGLLSTILANNSSNTIVPLVVDSSSNPIVPLVVDPSGNISVVSPSNACFILPSFLKCFSSKSSL